MNFLTPLAFALAALLPIVVALYFLKLRREEKVVPSVYLWRELVRDVAANAPWQRLRPNLLLLLQLLFLVALILALVRPFSWTNAASGSHLILVVDTSASMAATDVAPNRLATATEQAHRLAGQLPAGVPVTLIAAGSEAEVLLSRSPDRALLDRALNGLRPGPAGADVATALELAAALAAGEPEAQVVLLSDGGARLPTQWSASAALRYIPIGQSGENQAVAALSLDPGAAGQGLSAFVRVGNYGASDVQRRLALYAYTDLNSPSRLVTVRDLELPAADSVALTIPDLPTDTVALEARLDEVDKSVDVLAVDDQAWAVAPVISGAQIQVVGPGNRFLETVLALLPGVEVTTISLDDYEAAWKDEPAPVDDTGSLNWLTIYDGVLPERGHYPPGALFFLGPLHSTELFSVTGEISLPTALPASANEPLLRYVDLRDVIIQRSAHLELPSWGQAAIVTGDDSPLLVTGESAGHRLAVLAFDPRQSDLPLRVAFPLLLANLVEFLTPGQSGSVPAVVSPGQPLTLLAPSQAEALVVSGPDGSSRRLTPDKGSAVLGETATVGLYQVDWESEGEQWLLGRFAVNSFSPVESAVAPKQALELSGGGGSTVLAERPARQEWWSWLAWAGLILLVVEWMVQYRGTLARLGLNLLGFLKARRPLGLATPRGNLARAGKSAQSLTTELPLNPARAGKRSPAPGQGSSEGVSK